MNFWRFSHKPKTQQLFNHISENVLKILPR